MSGIVNKVKEVLHHDKHTTGTTTTGHNTVGTTGNSGVPEGVAGPHSSRVANAADPRIDSDLDNRAAGTHGHHGTSTGAGFGTTGATTGVGHNTTHTGTTGAGFGTTGATTGVGHNTTHTGTTGAGYGTSGTTHHTTGTSGPHGSNLLNKVDPTVDSNSYGTGQTGTHAGNHALGGTGDRGGLSNSTNAGPHNSNIANKVDPRVDSDLDHSGNRHGATTGGIFGTSGSHATAGSGTAQNTNGPHNSDTMNKIDPRVDADGDGSRTFPGNATHR